MAIYQKGSKNERLAKALMHDISVVGGGVPSQRQQTPGYYSQSTFIDGAQTVYAELINRGFDTAGVVNSALHRIAGYNVSSLDGQVYGSFTADGVATALVWFAEQLDLCWDDTIHAPYEVSEFQKTILGKEVYKRGRIASACANSSRASTGGGRRSSTPNPNGFKQSGSKLGEVRDLAALPGCPAGTRVSADSSTIYIIEGQSSKGVVYAYIKPINKSSAYADGNTNKVLFGSAKAYGDCKCMFDVEAEAQTFLDSMVAANYIPADVSQLKVRPQKATNAYVDSNGNEKGGYFMVGTNFGTCAIQALKLNETLEEDTAATGKHKSDWAAATKNYSKADVKELHTWMRRG